MKFKPRIVEETENLIRRLSLPSGLPATEVSGLLPADITIACHNSVESVTISGLPKSVADFVQEMQSKGIFAKEVDSSGYAFHSEYIAQAGKTFQENLSNVRFYGTCVLNVYRKKVVDIKFASFSFTDYLETKS